MRRIYATFSGRRYDATTELIVRDAPKFGATDVWVFDDVWLAQARPQHVKATEWFRNHPRRRGVDWFCFKPETIRACLERMSDDDLLLFTDGDTFPIYYLDSLYSIIARDGIMLFRANGWPHARVWTKRATFKIMGLDEPEYWESQCACARFIGFTRRHLPFVEEWLSYCLIPDCNTFDVDDNFGPQLSEFQEPRCEQAILGLLAHKYGHKLYREADEFGDTTDPQGLPDSKLDRDLYPRLFTQIYGQSPGDPALGSSFRNV